MEVITALKGLQNRPKIFEEIKLIAQLANFTKESKNTRL
jgi:hypothetical protein